MSRGHAREDDGEIKSEEELNQILGTGDTPTIYAEKPKLNTEHTVAYGGGSSVDRKTIYIDEALYKEIMSGKIKVKNMTPDQIVHEIWLHEHTEKSIDDGDNAVDVYQACHQFARANGRIYVTGLGADPDEEDEALAPALDRCMKAEQSNPPKDLWCGPYLDHPTARDKEILEQFRKHGVVDAFKASKYDMRYGYGDEECKNCRHFMKGKGPLRTCERTCGLVRNTRWCEVWHR